MSRIAKAVLLTAATGAAFSGAAGVAAADSGALLKHRSPIHAPINACGNNIVQIVGVLSPTFGNTCINSESGKKHRGGHGKDHHGHGHKN